MVFISIPFWHIPKRNIPYCRGKSNYMDKTIYSEGHKTLVGKLIQARKEKSLRQGDVAKLLGRTQSYVSKIEAGQRRVDIIQLKEFAKIYKKNQEPQLRQNLLLAHQIQGLLSEGKSDNIKQIAGWLNISPQRINQLRNFVLLCPKIQEEIFLGDNKTISEIPEYKLRQITDTIDWQEQEKLWQELLSMLPKQSNPL